jgi:4-aminobutyrate--pyruvate transaminase
MYQERDIIGHVRKVAPHFLKRLRALSEHPLVGEAGGIGLIGAIELVADKKSKKSFDPTKQVAAAVGRFAEEAGLIVRPLLGDRIALCPPLVINEKEIGELFDRFETALKKGLDWVVQEKLLLS